MSWSASARGHKHAIDGEARVAFASAKKQVAGHPASQRALRVHEDAFAEFLRIAPHECTIALATTGHFNDDGIGSCQLHLAIGVVVPEAPVTPKNALTEERPAK